MRPGLSDRSSSDSRPADATGCIGTRAPVGDLDADDAGLRNRVKARAEPRPSGTEIAATVHTSLAGKRFAEKQAPGSRPRRVARRSRLRPEARAGHRNGRRLLLPSVRRAAKLRKGDQAQPRDRVVLAVDELAGGRAGRLSRCSWNFAVTAVPPARPLLVGAWWADLPRPKEEPP
jgi:hypothetical protein